MGCFLNIFRHDAAKDGSARASFVCPHAVMSSDVRAHLTITRTLKHIWPENIYWYLLQSDINKLVSWRETGLLSFHPDKCKVLHIGEDKHYDYNIKSHVRNHVKNEKDIGVTFHYNLELNIHINKKINKANVIFSIIRRSYKYLTKESFLRLYKAWVRSNLEYTNSVWSPYKMKYIEALEKVQKRATKALPGLKDFSYEDRLKTLKLPTLFFRSFDSYFWLFRSKCTPLDSMFS